MRCLVTGGAGFLGSLICEKLICHGHEVICLDNLMTGKLSNIQILKEQYPTRFEFVEDDVKVFSTKLEINEVWNLASPASPPHYQLDPVSTLLTNVVGTERMLQLSVKNRAKFFQASTSEIYGDPDMHPQKESYRGNVNTIGIRACYDEGKRAAETLCFDFKRIHDLDIRVARIFNTYGPLMDPNDGRVVSNFIVNAINSRSLEIYGDGSQTRSFCYKTDLVDGFFKMMKADRRIDFPINLGNPEEYSVLDLANLIIKLTKSNSAIEFRKLPQDDPTQRCPDITLARELLGWQPNISVEVGLAKTIAFFRNQQFGENYNVTY